MKLRLVKTPRPSQKDMICLTTKGTFRWATIGAAIVVPDQAGHEIMAQWVGCFRQEADPVPKEAEPESEEKFIPTKGYRNKAARSSEG